MNSTVPPLVNNTVQSPVNNTVLTTLCTVSPSVVNLSSQDATHSQPSLPPSVNTHIEIDKHATPAFQRQTASMPGIGSAGSVDKTACLTIQTVGYKVH